MLKHLFKTRPGGRIGDDLYALAVAQARNPAFYTRLGVEDRIDARFEIYTLHVLLLVMRLRDEDKSGEAGRKRRRKAAAPVANKMDTMPANKAAPRAKAR